MRLPRPYVPCVVRERVLIRQHIEAAKDLPRFYQYHGSAKRRVESLIRSLFGDGKVHLHHRPALCNRNRTFKSGNAVHELPPGAFIEGWEFVRYDPPANDPDHLVYLIAGKGEEHDVETRVRGQHGQHSDLALARKRKRAERKAKRPKRRWPSRPLRSRNNLRTP